MRVFSWEVNLIRFRTPREDLQVSREGLRRGVRCRVKFINNL